MERSNMPEKDPNNTALFVEWLRQFMPYLTTFFLSTWGGVVNHITTLRSGRKKFQLKELIFDLVVSTFAGLITFYFCRSAGISETMSAVLIAISGHMGTRAIAGFETVYRRIIGVKKSTNEQN
jgi:hypothetical protein